VHDRGPGYDLGVLPTELDKTDALHDLLDVDEHLLGFQPRPDGGATFAVILFGAIQYALRVPDADASDQPTWLLRANKAAKNTPDAFGAVFGRLNGKEEVDPLRSRRGRARRSTYATDRGIF